MNSGYFAAAWNAGSSELQQAGYCSHLGTAAAAAAAATTHSQSQSQRHDNIIRSSSTITAPPPKASWTVPDLYDHSSLLECARCTINQGHFKISGERGHGQANMCIMEGDLMQDLHYNIEDEDDMCIGMEMKMMKKRKLTSEQARQLEASFEADKKLEAEKKQRLADQLGLQPRQVAVWFQNRRARSKTKQLELDFLTLKNEYDRVLAQRRSLQVEISRLSAQLQARSSQAKINSISHDSTSSSNSNNGDVVSDSTTLQIKMVSPTKDRDGFTSNSSQEVEKSKDGLPRLQDSSKSPNIHNYDWEPYDNGLWVFD